jgi:hypothetical protein
MFHAECPAIFYITCLGLPLVDERINVPCKLSFTVSGHSAFTLGRNALRAGTLPPSQRMSGIVTG